MSPLLTALFGLFSVLAGAAGGPAVTGWFERRAQRRADNAKVEVAEIRHTEEVFRLLSSEIKRREESEKNLLERIENLEHEREAWRTERVSLEGRISHLEQRLREAGIEP